MTVKRKSISEVGPDEVRVYDKFLTKHNPGLKRTRLMFMSGAPARKILVLGCLHIPMWDEEMVNRAINDNLDADALVLNGDILDCYSVSSWPKNKDIAFVHEYNMAKAFVDYTCGLFPYVLLNKGNHEERLKNYLASKLDPNVQWLSQSDPLQKIADGEVHSSDGTKLPAKKMSNLLYNPSEESFWDVIGNTVIMHPLSYSAAPMATAIEGAEYMEHKRFHFDCLCMGHTHYQGKIIRDARVLIETGCLANPMDYSKKGKLFYRPQQSGYAIIYQDAKGNILPNESNFIHLGTTVEHKDDQLKVIGKPRKSVSRTSRRSEKPVSSNSKSRRK